MMRNNRTQGRKPLARRGLAVLAGLAIAALVLGPGTRHQNNGAALAHPFTLPNGNSIHR